MTSSSAALASSASARPVRRSWDVVEWLDPAEDFNFRHFRVRHMLAELIRTYRRSGVAIGSEAPAFELESTDGTRLSLKDLRGRPVLLHFVSYTCPVTRGSAAPMRELHRRYGDRVQFVDILVRQAHPGERRGAYSSFAEKMADARRYQLVEGVCWRVVVDDLECTVQRAYGGMAASIYLLDADGRVAFYSLWGQAPPLTTAIDDLLGRGGRGAPAGGGIDAVPHLGAAIVAGQGGPARGGLLSFVDLELGFPSALLLMTVGRLARPILGPFVQRTTARSSRNGSVSLGPASPALVQGTIDSRAFASHLAGAIRFPTIAPRDGAGEVAAFGALHDYLAQTYPRVHAQLAREVIGARSLHYEWRGKDPSRPHAVLMGHLDVVPALPGTESLWTHSPWSGAIDGGFLYGRGALDDKSAVIAILESVEQLLHDGYQPERTFHLAFGGDEEVGGDGAQQIAARLRARRIDPAFVLDEGGCVLNDEMPGVPGLAAVIGIAEKGYFSLELSTEAPGGHSSIPSAPTAIGRLSRAISRLEARPFSARLGDATLAMLRTIAPRQPLGPRLVLQNPWLTKPLILRQLLARPDTATLVRTTTAPTIFHAGTTENILPSEARAIVNFQILPGDTMKDVLERVKSVIADPKVNVRPVPHGIESDPSITSDTSGPAFEALATSIRQTLGPPSPLVVPILTGPTDSRYWSRAGVRNVYRFTPFTYEKDWMARAHGIDERIAIDGLAQGVRFYMQAVRNVDAISSHRA